MNAAGLEPKEKADSALRAVKSEVVTLLFTDVAGSTRLKQRLGDLPAVEILNRHHTIVRSVLAEFADGEEVSTWGDSFFLVFRGPSEAVKFALTLQRRVRALNEVIPESVFDRVGIHVGEVSVVDAPGGEKRRDYFGINVDATSRVVSLAQPDQILITRFAFDNARQMLCDSELPMVGELSWVSHGHYAIKGVEDPLEICEVGERLHAVFLPPPDSEKACRHRGADGELVLGWRPAIDEMVPKTAWRLIRPLGEGGFGEVWLAEHAQLREKRVFKFCFRADRVRSLRREVTIFRILKERVRAHQNVVAVLDVYLEEPPFYIGMEFVNGEDLCRWAEARGGLAQVPLQLRLEIVAQIATALQAAHEEGILHRDVKPSNILIDQDGQTAVAKLTDFGIGQVMSQEVLAGLTQLGFTATVLSPESSSYGGTRLYMAPELLVGKPATVRSDIYSLGVVLFQMVVGDLQRPLTVDWLRQVKDPLLREDLKMCFAGDPDERFASAGLLAEQLRGLPFRQQAWEIEERTARARERAAYRRGLFRAISVAAVVVVAFGLIAYYALRAKQDSERHAAAAFVAEQQAEQSAVAAVKSAEQAKLARDNAETMVNYIVTDLRERLEPLGNVSLLKSAVTQLARYQAENPAAESPRSLQLEAISFVYQGDVLAITGNFDEAAKAYDQACRSAARLAVVSPGSVEAALETVRAHYRRGSLLRFQGEIANATAELEKSRADAEAALRKTSVPEIRRLKALATKELAQLQIAQTDAAGSAERLFHEALSEGKAAAAATDKPQWKFECTYPLLGLGELALQSGDVESAEFLCEEAAQIVGDLLKAEPQNALWQRQRATLFLLEARVAKAQTQDERARSLTEAAQEQLRQLVAREPDHPAWRWEFAEACYDLGILYSDEQNHLAATGAFETGKAALESVRNTFPQNAALQELMESIEKQLQTPAPPPPVIGEKLVSPP